MAKRKYEQIYDRIRGALAGVAVGDALGGPVEFMNAAAIQKKHGKVTEMIGGGWLNLKPGETTDDTAMTLAVAQGIAERPWDPVSAIGPKFIDWYNSKPKDIGGTCSMAINRAIANEAVTTSDWGRVGEYVEKQSNGYNAGNGALMRTVYTGLFYADPAIRAIHTTKIAEMTHKNKGSTNICVIYADAIHKAVFGGHPAYTLPGAYNFSTAPTGYVFDSMCNATQVLCSADSFEEAVIEAINRGGDADTIGAITGGLAGAYYGYKNIPKRWLNKLDPDLLKEIDRLAEIAYNELDRYHHQGK